jgi:hypothetical protein
LFYKSKLNAVKNKYMTNVKELFKTDEDGHSLAMELFSGPEVMNYTDFWNSKDNDDSPYFEDLEDGETYIMGFIVISNKWLSPHFCGQMTSFGLRLQEAKPLADDYVKYTFQHSRFSGPTMVS